MEKQGNSSIKEILVKKNYFLYLILLNGFFISIYIIQHSAQNVRIPTKTISSSPIQYITLPISFIPRRICDFISDFVPQLRSSLTSLIEPVNREIFVRLRQGKKHKTVMRSTKTLQIKQIVTPFTSFKLPARK